MNDDALVSQSNYIVEIDRREHTTHDTIIIYAFKLLDNDDDCKMGVRFFKTKTFYAIIVRDAILILEESER